MHYAEREHFRAAEGWSIFANASKRGQRALVHYAEREHFRQNKVFSILNSQFSILNPSYPRWEYKAYPLRGCFFVVLHRLQELLVRKVALGG